MLSTTLFAMILVPDEISQDISFTEFSCDMEETFVCRMKVLLNENGFRENKEEDQVGDLQAAQCNGVSKSINAYPAFGRNPKSSDGNFSGNCLLTNQAKFV